MAETCKTILKTMKPHQNSDNIVARSALCFVPSTFATWEGSVDKCTAAKILAEHCGWPVTYRVFCIAAPMQSTHNSFVRAEASCELLSLSNRNRTTEHFDSARERCLEIL